jgi:hypothetical protein
MRTGEIHHHPVFPEVIDPGPGGQAEPRTLPGWENLSLNIEHRVFNFQG